MAASYSEPPIPPYTVVIEHDGCPRGYVDMPQAWGDVADCAQFIANHLPPRGGYEFGIKNIDSGRMVSYMVPPATVHRRVRLTMQDIAQED